MRWFTQGYFISLLATGLLASCAGYSAVILCTANANEAVALATGFPPHWPAGNNLAVGFAQLRLALLGTTAGLGGLFLVLVWPRRGNLAFWLWEQGRRQANGLTGAWRALQPRHRRLALTLFALLTALRIVVSRLLLTFDDGTSYELFVRKSLFVVNTWYPLPNNHVFSNTLSWVFYQASPTYWWSMRVPVLLLSTVGTAGWFLGLLRYSSFRVAGLAVTLFSFLETSLYYAAEGRGYALLLVLNCLGFFCTLRLTSVARGWAGLALAGTLGLYTVPTFSYFLVAAYSWLSVGWLRRGAYSHLLSLGVVGLLTLLGAALLYAPLLLVSGPAALFQNVYIKPLAAPDFWRALPTYVSAVEGVFMGESAKGVLATLHLGVLAAGAVLVGFLALWRAVHRGQLAHRLAVSVLRIGLPALWFVAVPYILMLGQRVLAPSRTLLFKAVFMFLLVALEADWLLQWRGQRNRWLRPGLLLGVGLWISMQVVQLYRSNELVAPRLKTSLPAFQRLLSQPPEPVVIP